MTLRHLLSLAEKERSLHLKNGEKIRDFLNFLGEGRILLQNATEEVKDSVFQMVKELYLVRNCTDLDVDTDTLRSLCIFKEVQSPVGVTGLSDNDSILDRLNEKSRFRGNKKACASPVVIESGLP